MLAYSQGGLRPQGSLLMGSDFREIRTGSWPSRRLAVPVTGASRTTRLGPWWRSARPPWRSARLVLSLALLLMISVVGAAGVGCGERVVKLPECGNGEVEGRELCDDGNLEPGDGCDENCLLESRELCDNRVDDDGDGSADCADPDCFSNPLCDNVEVCSNGFDDDDDGLVDCADPDCDGFLACLGEEICDNSLDDDGDGLVDCDDSQCNGHPACGGCDPEVDLGVLAPGDTRVLGADTAEGESTWLPTCGPDGGDSYHLRFEVEAGFLLRIRTASMEGDLVIGVVREEEPGVTCELDELLCVVVTAEQREDELAGLPPGAYRLVVAPSEPGGAGQIQLNLSILAGPVEQCSNGVDDDGDGDIDCDDADCATASECILEQCSNGVDDDGDGDIDCDDADCATSPPCVPPEECANGVDDDADGRVDCADVDCSGTASCVGSDCVVNVSLGVLDRGDVVQGAFDTSLATDDSAASCGGAEGPDVVLAFELSTPANVSMWLEQSGDHVVTLFGEAGPGSWCDSAEIHCEDPGGSGRSAHATYLGLPAARYFIVVDAVTGDRTGMGTVELAVFDPLVELCDDGVDDDGDGDTDCADSDCFASNVCLPEQDCHDDMDNDGDGLADCADLDCIGTLACGPGACLVDRDLGVLQPGYPALVSVDTSTADDHLSASCARGGGGGDVVISLELAVAGDLIISGTQVAMSDHAVALMCQAGPGSECDAAEHACADGGSPGLPISTVVAGLPPGRYYLLVEPYGPGGAGVITLEVSLQP